MHAPTGLLRHGDPTKKVDPLRLPAPQVRALAGAQVRTVKNVLDRIEGFHQLNGRRHRGSAAPAVHRHARPLRDRAIVHLILGTGLRRAEVTGLDLAQLDPGDSDELRRVKKAKLNDVRGKGRTSRTVFLGRDARHAVADYLEAERPGDADQHSEALFLAAASIGARRPGGRLSPRSVNTIVSEIGRIHDTEVTDRDRQLGALRPHDLRHTFGYRLSETSGHNRAELERRLGHANDRYLRLYTNPPDDIAANYVEDLLPASAKGADCLPRYPSSGLTRELRGPFLPYSGRTSRGTSRSQPRPWRQKRACPEPNRQSRYVIKLPGSSPSGAKWRRSRRVGGVASRANVRTLPDALKPSDGRQ